MAEEARLEKLEKDLKGRTALVTGGARGIGRALCLELARVGAKVVICDLESSQAGMDQVKAEIQKLGGSAQTLAMDVGVIPDVKEKIGQLVDRGQRVDVLVNNVGMGAPGLFWRTDLDTLVRAMELNLVGTVALTRLLLPQMIERSFGYLVFMSSIQGIAGTPGFAAYSAAKGGLVRFAEALRRETLRHHIVVSTVLPPAVKTAGFEEAEVLAPRLMSWGLLPPISPEQVARRTVQGMLHRRAYIYCGPQSFAAAVANRVSHTAVGTLLTAAFREA